MPVVENDNAQEGRIMADICYHFPKDKRNSEDDKEYITELVRSSSQFLANKIYSDSSYIEELEAIFNVIWAAESLLDKYPGDLVYAMRKASIAKER